MRIVSLALGVACTATPLLAQVTPVSIVELETLHTEGDLVAGVGVTTRIDALAINDAGDWLLEVDTDNASTDNDGAMLRNGALDLTEGQALAMPVGSMLDSFDAINLNNNGDSGWNFFLDGTSGSSDDSGVYFNTTMLIQEGDATTAAGLTVGTPYIGFFDARINDSSEILVMASIDDPAIDSTVDRALIVVDTLGGGTQTLIAAEGDILPGQTEAVADFETGPHNYDFNASGQVMFIADLAGDTAVDHAVYLDSTLLAQEGGASPVAGRNWSTLSSAEVDVNDLGDYVISGSLDGDSASNLLIERSGAKLVQEGDMIVDNAFDNWALTSFGSGPVEIGNNGNVLWFGDWDNPDTSIDSGLFLNDQLIVQEGLSTIGGVPIDTLRNVQDGYALSDDGQWVMFRGVLDDGNDFAARIRVGPFVSLGQGLAGTGGRVPQLRGKGSLEAGGMFTLDLIGARPISINTMVFSITNISAPFKGGTLVPAPDFLVGGPLTNGNGERQFNLTFPAGVPSGLDIFLQSWINDPAGFSGFAASNGLKATTP